MSNVLSLRMMKYLLGRDLSVDSCTGDNKQCGDLFRWSFRTRRTRYLIDKLLGMPRALDDAIFAFSA